MANHQPGLPWEPTTVDGISGSSAIGESSLPWNVLAVVAEASAHARELPYHRDGNYFFFRFFFAFAALAFLVVGCRFSSPLGGRGLARGWADREDVTESFLEARWVERERVHARHEPSVNPEGPRAPHAAPPITRIVAASAWTASGRPA